MPRPPRTGPKAKPHSKVAAEEWDRAAMDPDAEWGAAIAERMLADCHPDQLAAVQDPATYISLLVGRGGSKTTTMRVRAVIKMVTIPRARIAYVATSRPEAERLNWEPMKQLVADLGVMDDFEFAEQKMRCTCKRTGATYQFFGADDKKEINKLRGQPFNEFQVDEAASHDPVLLEMMLDRAVGPRLGERDGRVVIGGTPGHVLYGLFYDATRPGGETADPPTHRPYKLRDLPEWKGWVGWSSHAWAVPDILKAPGALARYPAIAKNWAAALVTKERKGWSDDNPIWRREYLGEWAADSTTTMYAYRAFLSDGAPWNQWDPLKGLALPWCGELAWGEKANADDPVTWSAALAAARAALKAAIAQLPAEFDDYLYGYGQDLGSRDPYALNIGALSPSDPSRQVHHVFCFSKRRMYAKLMAQLLVGEEAVAQALRGEIYTEVGGLFGITGWPATISADLAGLGETLTDELQNVYGIKIVAAQKAGKFGAIEVVNGDLVDGRQKILAGSPLELQLASLQWKPNEYGQPQEDRAARNDHADSWTYFRTDVANLFGAGPAKPVKAAAVGGEERRRTPLAATYKPPLAQPTRSRPQGEFDSLLSDNDLFSLD